MEKQSVKMTVKEMLGAYTGLTEVIREKKLFASEVNLAIARNSKILEGEVKTYQESMNAAVEKYVHKDGNGNPETKKLPNGMQEYVFETDEQKEQYLKAVRDMEAAELEVDVNMITAETFGDANEQPTAYDLVALDFMLKE